MAGTYSILGRTVYPHQVAITTLTVVFVPLIAKKFLTPKAAPPSTPPIAAASSDEEKFITDFLKQADSETPAKH